MMQNTILKDLNRLSIPQAELIIVDNRLCLQVKEEFSLPMSLEQFPTQQPVAILPSLDQSVNACLTYDPDFKSKGPRAISDAKRDGSKIAACFLMLMGQQAAYYSRFYEDGVALGFENKDWKAFWQAFIDKQNYLIEGTEAQMSFQLVWK